MVEPVSGRRKLVAGFPCEDERMKAEHHRVEEGGTVLEPVGHLRAALAQAGAEPGGTRVEPRPSGAPAVQPAKPSGGEPPYRPLIRPLVPRLTLLDDGDLVGGETIRLREAVTVIGRTEGDVRLPHDPLVSGRHAEIVREGGARPHRWLLRDLGSSNGTFVRCARTVLRPDSLVMLGGRRFRFQPAPAASGGEAAAGCTLAVDVAAMRPGGWPTLVELGQAAGGLELRLAGHDLTIGQPGLGNAIEIADPLLAQRHARVICDPAGRWVLEALPSVNGVWAQVMAVQLAGTCRFQIGEQRFLFVVD